jgi:hypothetical protein
MEIRTVLLTKFDKNFFEIVQDPFGNYAIQFAIDTYGNIYCKDVIDKICKNILTFSLQKFSSNVVEKCIENCDQVY